MRTLSSKEQTHPMVSFHNRHESRTDSPLFDHAVLFLVRKNFYKLNDFINRSKNKDAARKYLLEMKYLLSKCSTEMRLVFLNIAMKPQELLFNPYGSMNSIHITVRINKIDFRLQFDRSRFGVDGRYRMFTVLHKVNPGTVKKLSIDSNEADCTDEELYVLCNLLKSANIININDTHLKNDLYRREGLVKSFSRFKRVDTDEDWMNKKNKDNK